jgi:hypothetical protein
MAITQAFPNSAKLEFLQGIHQAADVYMIALYSSLATLSKSTTVYSADNEVGDSGDYAAGGQVLDGYTAALYGDTATIDWTTDPTWQGATITAAGALIYNSSRANKAVAVLDFGGVITSTNGEFKVTLPEAAAGTALVRIA